MGRIGFHTSNFSDYSIEKTVEILVDLGFDAIELNLESADNFSAHVLPNASKQRRSEIRRVIEAAGLTLSSLSAHAFMTSANADQRKTAIAFVNDSIDLACDLGTDIVHMASGFVPQGATEEQAWSWLTDAVRQCVKHGQRHGVKVAMEAGVFPGLIVWNTQSMLELIDRVGHDDFYVNFDPSHYQPSGDDTVATFRKLRNRIIHMHAKDGSGNRDAFEFPPLGKGQVNWPGLVEAMIETDYRGCLSVEYEAHFFAKGYTKDPIGAARHSKSFLDEVFADWLVACGSP